MSSIVSLEQHVHQIYDEVPKSLLQYTPQLFTYEINDSSHNIKAHGSAILIRKGEGYYLITARHCVHQSPGFPIKIWFLGEAGKPFSIRGLTTAIQGQSDTIDLVAIHIGSEAVEQLSKYYKFLDYRKIMPSKSITEQTDYLVLEHPISQTSIDNKKKKLSSSIFLHLGKSFPKAKYPKTILRYGLKRPRYTVDSHTNTLIHYDQRRSTVMGSDTMSMGPQADGTSGCGVWYIHSYMIGIPSEASYSLMGIIIEHHPIQRLLLATNADNILSLLP